MNPLFAMALIAAASLTLPFASQAGEGPQSPSSETRRFGPYEALAFNDQVVNDVKVDEKGDVYLQLAPAHKDKQLVVKISNDYFANYRPWHNGSYKLISPPNQGKPDHAWTDYVNTSAAYIEYWMDGEVFLHLKRVDR